MGFESHKVVKEYVSELKKINETRDHLRSQMVGAFNSAAEAVDDDERKVAAQRVKDLESELSTLNSKGERYIRKIDELNGVREERNGSAKN